MLPGRPSHTDNATPPWVDHEPQEDRSCDKRITTRNDTKGNQTADQVMRGTDVGISKIGKSDGGTGGLRCGAQSGAKEDRGTGCALAGGGQILVFRPRSHVNESSGRLS